MKNFFPIWPTKKLNHIVLTKSKVANKWDVISTETPQKGHKVTLKEPIIEKLSREHNHLRKCTTTLDVGIKLNVIRRWVARRYQKKVISRGHRLNTILKIIPNSLISIYGEKTPSNDREKNRNYKFLLHKERSPPPEISN